MIRSRSRHRFQPSRRDVLKFGLTTAFAVVTTASNASQAAAQAATVPFSAPPNPSFPMPPSWETELRELAPNVYAYIQAGGPGRDNVRVSDAGVIVGDDGVMVIDTRLRRCMRRNLVAAIRKVTDKPFRHVINTHHHGGSRNGNQYFIRRRDRRTPVLPRRGTESGAGSGHMAETRRVGRRHRATRLILPPRPRSRKDDIPLRTRPWSMSSHGAGAYLRRHGRAPAPAQDSVRGRHWLLLRRTVLPERALSEVAQRQWTRSSAHGRRAHRPGPWAHRRQAGTRRHGRLLRPVQAGGRMRYEAKMSPGQAAADISPGQVRELDRP